MLHHQFRYVKCVFIAVFFLIVGQLQSQENFDLPNIEKVFLHTDRSSYTMGESLWYKAYSVLAYNHLLLDQSKVLYVELISPDSEIIARNKTKLDLGLGYGDFKLSDSLGVKKTGIYQLRAYTNWDRNFGDDFVFEKEIEIIDVFNDGRTATEIVEDDGITSKTNEQIVTEAEAEQLLDFQFFPEGGNLVEGITSIVAFKATDQYGNPVEIKGKIFDVKGNLVTLFTSIHDGMGKFQIQPKLNEQYMAEIEAENGKQIKLSLPEVSSRGVLLAADKIKGKDIISIKADKRTFQAHKGDSISVIGRVRGVTYFEGKLSLSNQKLSFELPKDQIPEGICQITLYDQNNIPQSERLYYVDKTEENDVNISLSINKKVFKPEESVEINITTKNKSGEPLLGSFSLASIDGNSVSNNAALGTNICSYFLMESDIKGRVRNPGFYFDSSNPNRLEALDVLLLTQGWRNFLWKSIPEISKTPQYDVEKGFEVSGFVKQLLGSKRKPNNNITLAVINDTEGFQLFNKVSDSLGQFRFKDLSFIGKTRLLVNTTNDKGKGKGELVLDSLENTPLTANFKPQILIKNTKQMQSVKQHVYDKYITYGVSPENVLEEVEIIAEKEDEYPSLYGVIPDRSVNLIEDKRSFTDIFQLLQSTFPGITVYQDEGVRKVKANRFGGIDVSFIIDGIPAIDNLQVETLPVSSIAKLDLVIGGQAMMFGIGVEAAIVIYLKKGSDRQPIKRFDRASKEVEGFYAAREFYTLGSEEDSDFEMNNSDAIQNTIYWNPYVHPDENGEVKLNYNNGKVATQVQVTIEGITVTGIPLVKKIEYEIVNSN